MNNDYYRNSTTPFLYTTSPDSSGANGVNIVGEIEDGEVENQLGDEPAGPVGMDCLPRCPSSGPGPFHYLINEQAKSLVVLQELQQEVGALLEFRDLVIETFPNLRNKMVAAVSTSSSTSSTSSTIPLMTSGNGSSTNIPLIVRRDWEPGVRVRRRILHHKDGECSPSTRSRSNSQSGLTGKGLNHQPKSTEATSVIQDSGFSTETSSSKETHSAASSTSAPTKDPPEEIEDELWNLLDVIHRKGTKLRDEVEALQGALCRKTDPEVTPPSVGITGNNEDYDTSFQRQMFLLGNTMEDVVNLRRERDILLEKLTEMESENLTGRVQASRLRADLESLLATKLELEEQLRIAVSQKAELNSRIHDMHSQFVKTSPVRNSSSSTSSPRLSSSPSDSNKVCMERPARRRRSNSKTTTIVNPLIVSNEDGEIMTPSSAVYTPNHFRRLNDLLGYDKDVPIKTQAVDSKKISAILQERDPLVLQQSLLTVTVHNQVLKERLEDNDKIKKDIIEDLSKARDKIDDLQFQLEEKSIELEGTRARVRVLEKGQLDKKTSIDIESPCGNDAPPMLLRSRQRQPTSCSTPSMKAMVPLALSDEGNNNSLNSSHQGVTEGNSPIVERDGGSTSHRRKPSRIPLPGAPVNLSATATIRSLSRNASTSTSSTSLPRPASAQSQTSLIPTPPRSASRTPKNSLTNGRSSRNNSDSLSRNFMNGSITSANSSIYLPGRSATISNKRDGLTTRMRRHNNANGSSRTNNSNFSNSGNSGLGLHGDVGDGGNNEVVAAEFNNPKLNKDVDVVPSSSPVNHEVIPTYPDSLDSSGDGLKSLNYFTDTNQLSYSWNRGSHCWFYSDGMSTASEYFDSIDSDDSRRMEKMFDVNGRTDVLAECCDSLEKNLEVPLPNCDVV